MGMKSGWMLLLAVLALGLAVPAMASDRAVTIINGTGYTIVEFYGSNEASESWEEDILGDDVLGPGASMSVDFDDGTDHCMFDFLAVFSDGEELARDGIDVCRTESFTYQ